MIKLMIELERLKIDFRNFLKILNYIIFLINVTFTKYFKLIFLKVSKITLEKLLNLRN